MTRLVRDEPDTGRVLEAIARTIGVTLGYRTVVINLYRPAWNDFEVTTVHGSVEARQELLGDTLAWEAWAPLLDDRFKHSGTYLIPHGSFDWSNDVGRRYVPAWTPSDDPGDWHPDDELFVPLLHSAGHLLGIISVGEPLSGRRPGTAELEVLVAVADHAALALESSQENAASQYHKIALDELLRVSSRLQESLATDTLLHDVCVGIRDALGFDRVALEMPDPVTGVFSTRAAVGWTMEELAENDPVSIWELAPLLDPPFELEGCYLMTAAEAHARLPRGHRSYRSQKNGSGPWAWDHHWLMVPLYDRDARVMGLIWVDDPRDRLLPSRPLLQALRVFANQATAALEASSRFGEMRFLAEHDPLTRLYNRRAFGSRLQLELARSQRYRNPFALVMCDLDGFKLVNDRAGHLAGDRTLLEVAAILTRSVRSADSVFRTGGDEFALILPETDREVAERVIQRLAEAMHRQPGHPASFGIAVCPDNGADPDALVRAADAAMYEAKRGGGQVRFAA